MEGALLAQLGGPRCGLSDRSCPWPCPCRSRPRPRGLPASPAPLPSPLAMRAKNAEKAEGLDREGSRAATPSTSGICPALRVLPPPPLPLPRSLRSAPMPRDSRSRLETVGCVATRLPPSLPLLLPRPPPPPAVMLMCMPVPSRLLLPSVRSAPAPPPAPPAPAPPIIPARSLKELLLESIGVGKQEEVSALAGGQALVMSSRGWWRKKVYSACSRCSLPRLRHIWPFMSSTAPGVEITFLT